METPVAAIFRRPFFFYSFPCHRMNHPATRYVLFLIQFSELFFQNLAANFRPVCETRLPPLDPASDAVCMSLYLTNLFHVHWELDGRGMQHAWGDDKQIRRLKYYMKKPLAICSNKCEDNIKIGFKEEWPVAADMLTSWPL